MPESPFDYATAVGLMKYGFSIKRVSWLEGKFLSIVNQEYSWGEKIQVVMLFREDIKGKVLPTIFDARYIDLDAKVWEIYQKSEDYPDAEPVFTIFITPKDIIVEKRDVTKSIEEQFLDEEGNPIVKNASIIYSNVTLRDIHRALKYLPPKARVFNKKLFTGCDKREEEKE